MRKLFVALATPAALVALAMPAAADQDEDDLGVPGHVTISAEQIECGKAKVKIDNGTKYPFGAVWSSGAAATVEGQHKGSFTDEVVLEFPEDAGDGEVQVAAVISEGAEQADYLKPGGTPVALGGPWSDTLPTARAVAKVNTDCEQPPDPTTDPTEDPDPTGDPTTDPTDPSGDPSTEPSDPTSTETSTSGAVVPSTSTTPVAVDNAANTGNLAETGVSDATVWLISGGALLLIGGGTLLFLARKRRATN